MGLREGGPLAIARRAKPALTTTRSPESSTTVGDDSQIADNSDRVSAEAVIAASDGGVVTNVAFTSPALPDSATRGARGTVGDCPPDLEGGEIVYPNPWQPPGLAGPWPYDEYIYDGGDRDLPADVWRDWSVHGLDMEDTVIHYDTRQGKTVVRPSNRVPIYAPRFAAVRKVTGPRQQQIAEGLAAVDRPIRMESQEQRLTASTAVQPVQPVRQHGIRSTVNLIERSRGVTMDTVRTLQGLEDTLRPYEDLAIIRRGKIDSVDQLRLAQASRAAIAWSSDQMVQVVFDGKPASQMTGSSVPQETMLYELPEGKDCVRIVKIASKSEAQPGEEIEFTIRFDNLGEQRIGNVTIIDSLTTRLEYVADSAECSLKSSFMTQENEGESLVLRWEITDPIKVGEGGIIRFKCRLR
jgi:uncharacterized repeat protein (TIGR01451 family)